jgi:hypothetical protein
MSQNGATMSFWFRLPLRTRLGIISTVLLIVAAVSCFLWMNDPGHHRPIGGIIRLAPILFLLWLAWTDLRRIPFWVWLIAPVVFVLCILKPALWLIVIPVTLFALFMHS